MARLRTFFVLIVLAACAGPATAGDYVFDGIWRTTNRRLDGTMRCVVTEAGDQQWQGRFYGVWRGVAFDYTAPFSGPRSQLSGTASIDGANYTWTGQIDEQTPNSFKGTFGGDRYNGYFNLKELPATARNPRD